MPESKNQPINESEFADAWKRFVSAVKRLLSGVLPEHALAPFLPLRDSALQVIESQKIVDEFNKAWLNLHLENSPEAAHLILMEVAAFPAAVDIAEAEVQTTEKSSIKKRLMGIGRTTVDSVHDILTDLPPMARAPLKVASEVLGIFRGD